MQSVNPASIPNPPAPSTVRTDPAFLPPRLSTLAHRAVVLGFSVTSPVTLRLAANATSPGPFCVSTATPLSSAPRALGTIFRWPGPYLVDGVYRVKLLAGEAGWVSAAGAVPEGGASDDLAWGEQIRRLLPQAPYNRHPVDVAQAIMRAQAQDEAGYRFLFEHYKRPVFRLILSHAGVDRDAADDILQTTFVRAFRNIARLEKQDRFEPWLIRIARRETWRALSQKRPTQDLDSVPEAQADQELEIEEKKNKELLMHAIRHAAESVEPESIRETARRYYFGPKTTTEALAKDLKIPHSTVRKRLFLFRKKLRARLLANKGGR